MSDWRKVADFLALRRNTTLLLLGLVLAGTGERLWLGFAPKYLETLGATVLIIGLFDALTGSQRCFAHGQAAGEQVCGKAWQLTTASSGTIQ